MGTHDTGIDPRESNPNAGGPEGARGGMGVSSERVGHTGPGQEATDGVRPTAPVPVPDPPPEQHPGNPEENPAGIPPKAGYPTLDPRHTDGG